MSFIDNEKVSELIDFRMNYYHIFTNQFRNKILLFRKGFSFFRLILFKCQKLLHMNRSHHQKYSIKYGSQWVSVTENFVKYLVAQERQLLKRFKFTIIPDESFVQTVLYNSPFKKNIFKGLEPNETDFGNYNLREIDFKRGNPWIWKEIDLEYLLASNKFFARKFSSSEYNVVNKLLEHLKIK